MLIELRVENHRSIREEQVLTMEASHASDPDARHVRVVEGSHKPLVAAAALYGANASGKSNLLLALVYMQRVVLDSHRFWDPDGGVVRDPFAWGETRNKPSLFEVTFIEDKVRYRYGFVVDDQRILEEWLHAWPHGRQQTWYERDADRIKFGDNLKGENRIVEEVTRPNALFLSAAVQMRHLQLTGVYRWFRQIRIAGSLQGFKAYRPPRFLRGAPGSKQASIRSLLQAIYSDASPNESLAHGDRVLALLRAADTGIVDFKLIKDAENSRGDLAFLHDASDPEAWLFLEQESEGTRALLELAGPAIEAIDSGRLLIVDELDRSMHPLLAIRLLQQFNDPATNPKNAQLLFATHDSNLLGTSAGPPALARDQVWLTEKTPEGATTVYPLTDYKPRKNENLERGYLQGRYGAIPFLSPLMDVEGGDDA